MKASKKWLALLKLDIRQKCRQHVSQALNLKTHAENLWKYIWTIAGKTYFTNVISFTKFTWISQNSDLQLLQFDIRSKCMYRVSKVLKHAIHSGSLQNTFGRQHWKFSFENMTVLLRSCDCFKILICNCISLIVGKNAVSLYQMR